MGPVGRLDVLTVLVDVVITGDCVPAPRPRVHRGGAHYPARYVDYRTRLQGEFLVALRKRGHRPRHDGPVRLTLTVFVLRAGDADNYAKTVMDALTDVVLVDDKQVIELHVMLVPARLPGGPTGVHVVVETIGS